MKKFLIIPIFLISMWCFAQTDSASYHSITKLNDSTLIFNRPNGTKDTIKFSFYPNPGGSASYANSGGTGNRTGSITTTSNGTGWRDNGGNESEMVNGNLTGVTWWASGGSNSGMWLKFDFGSGNTKVIQEAKWYQSTSDSHGTWKWQGSNDNSSWTDIGSSFTLGGATTQTQTSLSGNTTAYRYYKLAAVSGSASGNPYIYEIEFKLY